MFAEIKLPDGDIVYHDGKRWLCLKPKSKVIVDYFTKTLPPGDYPNAAEATIRHVVGSMVEAKLLSLDPEEEMDTSDYEHLFVK